MPFEEGVGFDLDEDEEVAIGAAVRSGLTFVGEAETHAVVDSRRDIDLELTVDLLVAVAAALAARVADHLAGAAAGAAGAADREEALLIEHLTAAVAGRTGAGAGAGLGAFAAAVLAVLHTRHLDLRVHAENGLFEPNLEIVADILATLRTVPPAAAALAEEI